jgi:intraflagellar transport protein 81
MLQGEDFKKYVSELRGKSTLFKQKKAKISSILTESGILSRTQQVIVA